VAEQATEPVMVEGPGGAPVPYDPAHLHHNSGRPISWVGTSITIVGFVIGGIAFPISNPAPNWILFWVGTVIAIFGILVLAVSRAIDTDWY
jgi:hypothetical protein